MRFRIDLKIIFFLVCFYFTKQLNIYCYILIFTFFHELGHLVVGLFCGFKPNRIEMLPFGFHLEYKTNFKKNKKQFIISNILVSIAGPITNLFIILIIMVLHISFMGRDIVVYSNLIIFALNMMPIYPLDGGRIVNSILEIFYGKIKADLITNKISYFYMILLTMISSIAILYLKNISIFLIILYLWQIIIKENNKYIRELKIVDRLYTTNKKDLKNYIKKI